MVHSPPHPGPLPQLPLAEREEMSSAFLKIRATGFAGQLSASQKPFATLSSPGGEETGEGERQNQIHSGSRPSQTEFRKRVPLNQNPEAGSQKAELKSETPCVVSYGLEWGAPRSPIRAFILSLRRLQFVPAAKTF